MRVCCRGEVQNDLHQNQSCRVSLRGRDRGYRLHCLRHIDDCLTSLPSYQLLHFFPFSKFIPDYTPTLAYPPPNSELLALPFPHCVPFWFASTHTAHLISIYAVPVVHPPASCVLPFSPHHLPQPSHCALCILYRCLPPLFHLLFIWSFSDPFLPCFPSRCRSSNRGKISPQTVPVSKPLDLVSHAAHTLSHTLSLAPSSPRLLLTTFFADHLLITLWKPLSGFI